MNDISHTSNIDDAHQKSNIVRKESKTLVFHEKPLEIVEMDGQEWVTSKSIAQTLGYKDTSSINRIFKRREDEFTDKMSRSVKMTALSETNPYKYDLRVFSLRGAYLVSMASDAPIAKEFRKWVLDVLEEHAGEKQKILIGADSAGDYKKQIKKLKKFNEDFLNEVSRLTREKNELLATMNKEREAFYGELHCAMTGFGEVMNRLDEAGAIDLKKEAGRRLHESVTREISLTTQSNLNFLIERLGYNKYVKQD